MSITLSERTRTLRCPKCAALFATSRRQCPACHSTFSVEELAAGADREDTLLKMDHDASHALHSAMVAYGWYALFVLYIGRDVFEGLIQLDFDAVALAMKSWMFVLFALLFVPLFLAYALYLIVSWRREFSGFIDNEPRMVAARRTWRRAVAHFTIGLSIYALVNVLWFL